jgi:exoribonuclease R
MFACSAGSMINAAECDGGGPRVCGMVRRVIRLAGPDPASVVALRDRFAAIRHRLGIAEDFPPDVLAAAETAAKDSLEPSADLRDVPFVTVDPPGSTDLDQALHLARRGDGYHLDYAIADVPAFVPVAGPVDVEARRRGQTLYAPDGRVPLHPPVLSEDAASLLPGQVRPAFVWRFELDAAGELQAADVVRALVRSRHRLDYGQVQAAADAVAEGARDPDEEVAGQAVLLREVGVRRITLEAARGGANLPLPEQEVTAQGGGYTLALRAGVPAEDWNAQLSLLTGMAAATLMLDAGVGLLRTLPPPEPGLIERFRRQAQALGVPWPAQESLGALLRRMRRDRPNELALMHEAGALFRGAGYAPLLPGAPAPQLTTHAAVAAPYAHVTAPLRRLVDRFGLVACEALRRGREVPEWVVAALPGLPPAMSASDQLAGRLERACTDLVEAAVLAHRVGEEFDAVAVDLNHSGGGKVQLLDPTVVAPCTGDLALGEPVRVRLDRADLDGGAVTFSAVPR